MFYENTKFPRSVKSHQPRKRAGGNWHRNTPTYENTKFPRSVKSHKLRALLEQDALSHIEPDPQTLMLAEGLAMRPGPRPRMDPGLLGLLRDAIKSGRVVAFDYRAQATGKVTRREVQPYGIIYGNRAFLAIPTEAPTCACGGHLRQRMATLCATLATHHAS